MTHKNLFIGIDEGASFCRTLMRDMQGNFVLPTASWRRVR
jgi:hypothetical protein